MKLRDLTGQTFGRLTAIRRVENLPGYGQARWLFSCSCGNEVVLFGYNAVHGRQKSCGCFQKENPARLEHGKSDTRAAHTWAAIRQRCENPSNSVYADYGGRGIVVCERWQSFANFLADMGEPPDGLTLDRIDNDGPYSPGNCRWATRKEQVRNRRKTNFYTFNGETLSLPEWADRFGLPYKVVWFRYSKMGWREEKLFSPLRKISRRSNKSSLV